MPTRNDVGINPRGDYITHDFERMVKDGLRMRRGKSYRNLPSFSPVIRPRCNVALIFGDEEPERDYKYMGEINVKAIRLYAESCPRKRMRKL